jgi:hypothetical protein
MTEKLFKFAGTSTTSDGTTKARWANNLVTRVKTLVKNGNTDIQFVELPHPMDKLEALRHLKSLGLTGDASFAVDYKIAEKVKMSKKKEHTVTLSKTKKVETVTSV